MLRDLIKEGGLYTLANLLTKGLSLLLIPFYTAYFVPADYGVIGILSIFGVIFTVVFSLQLNQSLARFVGDETIAERLRIRYASSAINFVFLVFLILTIAIVLVPEPIIWLLSEEEKIPVDVLQLAIISISINGIFYMLGVYLRFLRKANQFALSFIVHAVLNIGLTFYLVIIEDMGINGIYFASITVTPLVILYQLFHLRRKYTLYIGKKELYRLIGFGIFLIPAGLSQVLLNFADRLFIVKLEDFDHAGIYDIAGKFASIVSLVVTGFSMAIMPLIYSKHADSNARSQLSRIFHLYMGIGGVFILCLSVFSYETLVIFTNESYYEAHVVMPILYGSAFIAGVHMFSPGLLIQKKTSLIAIIVMSALAVNIVLNLLMIPKHGNLGAAMATIIATTVHITVLFIFSQKHYRFKVRGFTLSAFILGYTIFLFASYNDPFELLSVESVLYKLGLCFLFTFFVFLIKLVGLTKLKEFLSFGRKNLKE